MNSSYDKFQKRRVMTSYFSVVISIFLVLFLLGLLGFFVASSKKLTNDFKEQIVLTVFFKSETKIDSIKSFEKKLRQFKFAKSFHFVSKEQAAKEHKDIIGEDFMKFLGMNPLQNSFDIYLKADYINKSSMERIERKLRSNDMISDIVYDKQLINLINNNIQKVTIWILIISSILSLIAILLINSSLRLSIHSNRFIIKTMQMVGATKSFIRKPYILQSMKLGLIGSILAVIGLISTLTYIENSLHLGLLDDKMIITSVLVLVVFGGILITWISTYFATQRFLNLRTDKLY